jgi:hypothetical protein
VTLRGGERGARELHAAVGKKKQMAGGGGSGFIGEEGREGLEEAAAWRDRGVGEADEWAQHRTVPILIFQLFSKLLCIDSIQRLSSGVPTFPNKICMRR